MNAHKVVTVLLETDDVDPKRYIDSLDQFIAVEGDWPCMLDVYSIAHGGFQPDDDPEGFSVSPPPQGWTLLGTVKSRAADISHGEYYREIMLPKDQRPPDAYRVIKFNGLKPEQVASMFPQTFPSIDAAGHALKARLKR